MSLFTARDARFVEAAAELSYCNPFLAQRIDLERRALGNEFDERAAVWNLEADYSLEHPNLRRICERGVALLDAARQKIAAGYSPGDRESQLYEDLGIFVLYHRYREGFDLTISQGHRRKTARNRTGLYELFAQDARRYFDLDERELTHLFASFFQIRRAFHNIIDFILGRSAPVAQLRAEVWQSIFTCDMRRYRRTLYDRMADYTTLVIGPTGTGKELVARAIGLSRYIPFDPRSQVFTEDFAGSFYPLSLAAMSPTLIESELFGHIKGAFTGAVADREGWLEACRPLGTVFLDEVGELEAAIQVKLLRVLQSREFSRLGETQSRRFEGKIIAATHRDLGDRMRTGRFREDLYYRLCSDLVVTPSLRERLADQPEELRTMIAHIARRIVGDEAEQVADEVEAWVERHLGREYAWPGNVRELEQCVRNVLIRRSYLTPSRPEKPGGDGPRAEMATEMVRGSLSAEGLLARYCTLVVHQRGGYEQAARHLGLDRRTVKAKVDQDLLRRFISDPR